MEDKEFIKKLDFADSIEDVDEKINYLNLLQSEAAKISEKEINLSKNFCEDRINHVSLKLNNLDNAYLDYVLKTKIFLTSLEKSE